MKKSEFSTLHFGETANFFQFSGKFLLLSGGFDYAVVDFGHEIQNSYPRFILLKAFMLRNKHKPSIISKNIHGQMFTNSFANFDLFGNINLFQQFETDKN